MATSNTRKAMIKASEQHVQHVVQFIEKAKGKALVITGAGISTDSGIPDYRGPNGVYMRNKNFKPIQFQQFASEHKYRQRYWARSFLGWPKISSSQPNDAHFALTQLQIKSYVDNIITQNVDRLHTKSGSRGVLEIHGSLHEVQCLSCGEVMCRNVFQKLLAAYNPEVAQWSIVNPGRIGGDVASSVNPDGDVEITWNYDDFIYPSCARCGGILKPKVVFFGENMPMSVRNQSFDYVNTANAVLVVGSSLQVYSALRLINQARERKIPVAILNLGPTRGDNLCDMKLDAHCTNVLTSALKAINNSI